LIEKGCEAVSVVEMLKKLHPVPTKESMSAINAEKNGRQYTYRLYNKYYYYYDERDGRERSERQRGACERVMKIRSMSSMQQQGERTQHQHHTRKTSARAKTYGTVIIAAAILYD